MLPLEGVLDFAQGLNWLDFKLLSFCIILWPDTGEFAYSDTGEIFT